LILEKILFLLVELKDGFPIVGAQVVGYWLVEFVTSSENESEKNERPFHFPKMQENLAQKKRPLE
jgi:hypothetical protein